MKSTIFVSLTLTLGAWSGFAQEEGKEYQSEWTWTSRRSGPLNPDEIEEARPDANRQILRDCFQKGFSTCALSSFSAHFVREEGYVEYWKRPVDGFGSPVGPPYPVYAYKKVYVLSAKVIEGSTIEQTFGVHGYNDLDKMKTVLEQQESSGYQATLKIGDESWKGHLTLGTQGQLTAARASRELPIRADRWGHPGEFALKFRSNDQDYTVHGRVNVSHYVFGTEVTVHATVFDQDGKAVGSLDLDD